MSFLTGPRTEIVEEYLKMRRKKGRFLIPIGEQVLHLSTIERKDSRAGNTMVVLTIRKAPEESYTGSKESFLPIIIYNLTDYSYKNACNSDGIPYGIVKLKEFFLNAYGYKLERKGKTPDELIDGIVEQGITFKKKEFNAVVRHKKILAKDISGEVVTKQRGSMITIGKPILNYEPELWQLSPIDIPINLPVEAHRGLIVQLSTQQQIEYANLFNEKIECDYQQGFL